MSRHDDIVSLHDMLNHAKEAVVLLGTTKQKQLGRNRVKQLALTRLIEIIGESANRVSQATRQKYPQIPWSQIIGMRNRLIHGYDIVDYELLWATVTTDLPPLITVLEEVLESS
ncbi:MAG: DUF86 domain-containing protein [Candidatus Aminicenantes bacterium]|nr:DUF86 domain-containing protein [Candidatus Aminicenantes bacterium]